MAGDACKRGVRYPEPGEQPGQAPRTPSCQSRPRPKNDHIGVTTPGPQDPDVREVINFDRLREVLTIARNNEERLCRTTHARVRQDVRTIEEPVELRSREDIACASACSTRPSRKVVLDWWRRSIDGLARLRSTIRTIPQRRAASNRTQEFAITKATKCAASLDRDPVGCELLTPSDFVPSRLDLSNRREGFDSGLERVLPVRVVREGTYHPSRLEQELRDTRARVTERPGNEVRLGVTGAHGGATLTTVTEATRPSRSGRISVTGSPKRSRPLPVKSPLEIPRAMSRGRERGSRRRLLDLCGA